VEQPNEGRSGQKNHITIEIHFAVEKVGPISFRVAVLQIHSGVVAGLFFKYAQFKVCSIVTSLKFAGSHVSCLLRFTLPLSASLYN
jgi:hypothetical protein